MRIEIRNESVLLDGYVNAVGRSSKVLPSPKGKFTEQIVPKTFAKALLKAVNVDLLFNHNKSHKLGSLQEGNLELREDNIGLRAIATITDKEVMEKAKSGALQGWSFGFVANSEKWLDGTDGVQLRMVDDIDLIEVSVLDKSPAYIATSLEVRGDETLIIEERFEEDVSEIEDKTVKVEEIKKSVTEERTIDYSIQEHEITLLRMKGSLNK